jgi:NADH:ubiquinone oxidoreductase subunit 6 (subunit J)
MHFSDIPVWIEYLFKGLLAFAMLAFSGITATKTGRKNPYYALLLLVPFLQIAVVWAFAFVEWPKLEEKRNIE